MSEQTKKRFKNLGKTIGIGLFTLVMLTNIKFALLDDNELASGDISVSGIEIQLFEATYANEFYDYWGNCMELGIECYQLGSPVCTYIVEPGMFCFYTY